MDQYPFEFIVTIAGKDVDNFISDLKKLGFPQQAKDVEFQYNNQLKEI